MSSLLVRIGVNAVSLWAAASLIDGIELSDDLLSVVVVAAIFGLVNAFLKPIALLLSLPLLIITVGLFTVVVNAAMLAITDSLSGGLSVDGFWPAVFGAVVISLVSWALSSFLGKDDSKQNPQQHRPQPSQ
jgi:putative membrane protein